MLPPNGDVSEGKAAGGASGRAGGIKEVVEGQITLWLKRAIIYYNSGPVTLKERKGEVVWSVLTPICLSPPNTNTKMMATADRGREWREKMLYR